MSFRPAPVRLLPAAVLILLICGAAGPIAGWADDAAQKSKAKAKTAAAKDDDRSLTEQWDELFARRQEMIEKLTALQEEFPKADADRKQEIRNEFLAARDELLTEIVPKLDELAPQVFAADPKNLDAGESAVRAAFQHNHYDEAIKLADQVLAVDENRPIVMNILGVA